MQDNEDLVFSFLNSDYLAESDTSSNTVAQLHESRYFTFDDKTWDFGLDVALATQDPPSPPWSETASTDSSLLGSPKLESSDDRSKEDDRDSSSSMDDVESGNHSSTLAHMDTDCWQFVSPGLVASAASKVANVITPTFEVSGSFDSLTAFTAMVPLPPALHLVSNDDSMAPGGQSVALQYPALSLAPSSHPSSGSSSSSDSEQPKRKRGRKKRDSASSVTSVTPLLLKPLMPILPQTAASTSPSSTITPLLLAATHDAHDSLKPIKSELPPSPPLAPSTNLGLVSKAQTPVNSDTIGVALSAKKRPLIAPGLLSSTATSFPTVQIKSEPVQPSLAMLPALQQKTPILPAPSSTTSVAKSTSPAAKSSNPQTPQDVAAAALAKRQERLIKNRAAALLSRKRKREHITLLEQHTEALASENTELKEQVEALEDEVDQITAENCRLVEENKRITDENEELRRRVTRLEGGGSRVLDVDADRSHGHHDRMIAVGTKNSRTTGVVFMIILFSFALFSLPTGNLSRLTVGGATRPLIAPSPSLLDQPMSPLRESLLDAAPRSTPPPGGISEKDPDVYPKRELLHAPPGSASVLSEAKSGSELVLIKEVQTKELQTWLSKSLESATTTATEKRVIEQTDLIYQSQAVYRQVEDSANPHAYLYCANLVHLMPNDTVRRTNADDAHAWPKPLLSNRPRLSLLSPLGARSTADFTGSSNHSNPSSDSEGTLAQYLQIDVEVLSSHPVTANLVSLGSGLGSGVGVQNKSLFDSLDGDKVALQAPALSHPSPSANAAPSELRIWKAEETDVMVVVKQERMDEDVWPMDGANETVFVNPPVDDGIVRKTKRRRVAELGRERKMRSGRVLRPLDKA